MNTMVDQIVIPGTIIGSLDISGTIRLGPGLIQDHDNVIATKAGILRSKNSQKYWIENSQKRVC